jgi:hypothetical protein
MYLWRRPSQSRVWIRWRDMSGYIEEFHRHLVHELGVDRQDERIIDTIPVPVCKFFRRRRHEGFLNVDWGYCVSDKWYCPGCRLGLRVSTAGRPDCHDLFDAQPTMSATWRLSWLS